MLKNLLQIILMPTWHTIAPIVRIRGDDAREMIQVKMKMPFYQKAFLSY